MRMTLHYLFSATAQTLAGALGIIGAVAYFRIEALRRRLRNAAESLLEGLRAQLAASHFQLRELCDRELWADFQQLYSEVRRNVDPSVLDTYAWQAKIMHDELAALKRVREQLVLAVVLATVGIATALICLCFVPMIADSSVWTIGTAGTVLVLGGLALISLAFLVCDAFIRREALRPPAVYCVRERFEATKQGLAQRVGRDKPLSAEAMKNLHTWVLGKAERYRREHWPEANIVILGPRCHAEHPHRSPSPNDEETARAFEALDQYIGQNLTKWVAEELGKEL